MSFLAILVVVYFAVLTLQADAALDRANLRMPLSGYSTGLKDNHESGYERYQQLTPENDTFINISKVPPLHFAFWQYGGVKAEACTPVDGSFALGELAVDDALV